MGLVPGRLYRLAKGATITFGHSSEQWLVTDVSPPRPMVVDLATGEAILASDGMLALPSNQAPECTLFWEADETWRLEDPDGGVRRLTDGETLECSGRRFRFCAARFGEATASVAQASDAEEPSLRFSVSCWSMSADASRWAPAGTIICC
jgi:hypothetical protein